MKTTLIAAGALMASTLAGLPAASAGNAGFGVTLAGPNGYFQISAPGNDQNYKQKKKAHNYKPGKKAHNYKPGNGAGYGYGYNKGQGYGSGYGYGQGYGSGNSYGQGYGQGRRGRGYGYGNGYGGGNGYGRPYPGHLNLSQARALGYCKTPREIRRKLRHKGWHGFNVRKIRPAIAIVHSRRHGQGYRLRINRCTGAILNAKPRGGYRSYGYY